MEGIHYLPKEAKYSQYFRSSEMHSVRLWKGGASYRTQRVMRSQRPAEHQRGLILR
ncbi:MAG: hypothetical protein M3017_09780 [Actinomycetota bacterium]|nr:hypothetical protein [Actinomycetota bacterium]